MFESGEGGICTHATDSGATSKTDTLSHQERSKALRFRTDEGSTFFEEERNDALSRQIPDASLHKKCATCVQQFDREYSDELLEVVRAWNELPAAVQEGILAMVRAVKE